MSRRGLVLVLIGLGIFVIGYLVTSRGTDLPQGALKITVAPAKAKILLDGSAARAGDRQTDIGEHRVKITMPGFKPYERTINITQATETYVGVILTPNSPNTKGWFTKHPDDQKLTEAINDQASDSRNAEVATKYPIFNRLPVVFGDGAGGLTKIEHEAAINGAGKPSIGIYASTPLQRQLALKWIYNNDFTLSDIDVIFYGSRIPIRTDLPL